MSSLANNKGNGIQYDTLEKICKYLDITPGELLTIIDFNVDYVSHKQLNENFYELLVNFKINNEEFECLLLVIIEIGVGRVGEPSIKSQVQIHKNPYSKIAVVPTHMLVEELDELIAYSILKGKFDDVMFESETKLVIDHGKNN